MEVKDMREVALERLRTLDLSGDGDSLYRLGLIAEAIRGCRPQYGWTMGACERLRDVLADMLGDDSEMRGFFKELKDLADWRRDVTLFGADYTPYPLDANAEPIHVGDEMEYADGRAVTVTEVSLRESKRSVIVQTDKGASFYAELDKLTHRPTPEGALGDGAGVTERYVPLPTDANGEVIHVGDKVRYADVVLTTKALTLNETGWSVTVANGRGDTIEHYPCSLVHVHEPTVADILRDFATKYAGAWGDVEDEIIERYAAKLQIREG